MPGERPGRMFLIHPFFYLFPPRPFPTEESVNDEDIYKGLPDLIEYVEHLQQNLYILRGF